MIPDIKEILYATDLSAHARKAMAYAVSLANAYGASLTILHVMEETSPNAELLTTTFLGYNSVEEMQQKNREQIIKEIKSQLTAMCNELGCQLPACRFSLSEIHVEIGRPEEILSEWTECGKFDFLILGRHDYGMMEMLLGHSSKKVVRHSPIPVLLVPVDVDRD